MTLLAVFLSIMPDKCARIFRKYVVHVVTQPYIHIRQPCGPVSPEPQAATSCKLRLRLMWPYVLVSGAHLRMKQPTRGTVFKPCRTVAGATGCKMCRNALITTQWSGTCACRDQCRPASDAALEWITSTVEEQAREAGRHKPCLSNGKASGLVPCRTLATTRWKPCGTARLGIQWRDPYAEGGENQIRAPAVSPSGNAAFEVHQLTRRRLQRGESTSKGGRAT